MRNRVRSLTTLPATPLFRTAGVPPALLTLLCVWILQFGGSPRIHAGEERFSAPKKLPSKSRASALGLCQPPPAAARNTASEKASAA